MLTSPIVPVSVVVVRIIVVVSKCRFEIDCAVCIDSIIDYRHFSGHRLPLSLSLVHGGNPSRFPQFAVHNFIVCPLFQLATPAPKCWVFNYHNTLICHLSSLASLFLPPFSFRLRRLPNSNAKWKCPRRFSYSGTKGTVTSQPRPLRRILKFVATLCSFL